MLQLRTNRYVSIFGYNGMHEDKLVPTNRSIRYQHSTSANRNYDMAGIEYPLSMNEVFLTKYYFEAHSEYVNTTDLVKKIEEKFMETKDSEELLFITGYVSEPNYKLDNIIDPDIWTEIKEGPINTLLNKCASQVAARDNDGFGDETIVTTHLYKAKAKHALLLITNYPDRNNESLNILTIGLVPILFPDIKEKLCPEELDYFKELVNRSQLKRIVNTNVITAFNKLDNLPSYREKEKTIKFKNLLNNIADRQASRIKNKLAETNNRIERCMHDYDVYLKEVTTYNMLLKGTEGKAEQLKESLLNVSNMKEILSIEEVGSEGLSIMFKTTLDYFNTEEAEIIIDNLTCSDIVIKFLKDLYIDQIMKLNVVAITTYYYDNDFRSMGSIPTDYYLSNGAFFNPHLQYYSCMGDYKPQAIKAMREQDLLMFVNICLAATRSLNFGDATVMNAFVRFLEDALGNSNFNKTKCLTKDGIDYSIRDWKNNFNPEPQPIDPLDPMSVTMQEVI